MRKLTLVSIISLLVVGLLSWGVLAGEPQVWDTATGEESINARVLTKGYESGSCNKPQWTVNWTTHASVAQWIDFTFGATSWNWYVRKPGDYYADCIELSGRSNGDIVITFSGFADLEYVNKGEGVNETIETWYYAADDTERPDGDATDWGWIPAADLNSIQWEIKDSADLHGGDNIKLWNRIKVVECNSACEYEDTGEITITLQNQKDWIDDDGEFDAVYFGDDTNGDNDNGNGSV